MVLVVAGIVVAIAVLAILMLRKKRTADLHKQRQQGKSTLGRRRTEHKPSGPFTAVSIKTTNDSCSVAFEMSNLRYLESAAPSLPVEGCNSPDCHCSFLQHPDRRSSDVDEDRRMGIGLQTELYGSNGERNRRESQRGRRLRDRH